MALVGFFDILGTRDAVMKDRFSDLMALDFVGPAGLAAHLFPTVRFAAFSDSVIVSADTGYEEDFLKAVSVMYGQWYADFVLVRGGIAEGEIRWVDYTPVDEMFSKLSNLMFARVYGKGLVLAYELEQKSGPGAIPYLTERAADVFIQIEPNSVLPGVTPMLCWASEREANVIAGYAQVNLEHEPNEGHGRRHAIATSHYWSQVNEMKKFLPRHFQVIPAM
jgi:hypothetical protein